MSSENPNLVSKTMQKLTEIAGQLTLNTSNAFNEPNDFQKPKSLLKTPKTANTNIDKAMSKELGLSLGRPDSSQYGKKKGKGQAETSVNYQSHQMNFREMSVADWQGMYNELWNKFLKKKESTERLQEELLKRQERYIKREQEYRKTIDDLQKEMRIKSGYENDSFKKNFDNIKGLHTNIMENIGGIQNKTVKILQDQEKDIIRVFNAKLNEIKKKIEEEKSKKADNSADMKERENELNHHLELMTNIAQRIDAENRALMRKNGELKIEYKAQENDRETLLKQLVLQKKENAKLKELLESYKSIVIEEDDVANDIEFSETNNPNLKSSTHFTMDADENARARLQSGGTGRNNVSNAHFKSAKTTSSGFYKNKPATSEEETIQRYEKVIEQSKKILEAEQKKLKVARASYSRELQGRTELEEMFKQAVDKIKEEKEIQSRVTSSQSHKRKGKDDKVEIQWTQQDREKIIEYVLGQERVLGILYEKTFPQNEMQGLSQSNNRLNENSNNDINEEEKSSPSDDDL